MVELQLSVRDDHDANICANCILSIEAFFKYKAQCVQNDRLLRKKRVSFFAELGLAADSGDGIVGANDLSYQSTAAAAAPELSSKRRRLSRNGDGGELGNEEEEEDDELSTDRKRHRTGGLPDDDDDDSSGSIKKPYNGDAHGEGAGKVENDGEEADLGPYQIKQEAIDPDRDGEEENRNQQQQHLEDEDDDEEEYFNPNQFLAQETQIDEEDEIGEDADNDVSSDGDGQQFVVANGAESGDGGGAGGSATGQHQPPQLFERGWKTTEFSPQPGSSGLKTLKITDYSNVTGKRGRPQRFVTEMLSMAAAAAAAASGGGGGSGGGVGGNTFLPYHPGDAMYQQWQRLKGLANARLQADGRVPLALANPPHGRTTTRVLGGVIEPTKKVQKFLDDGLRELIYNAGAPNPHFARVCRRYREEWKAAPACKNAFIIVSQIRFVLGRRLDGFQGREGTLQLVQHHLRRQSVPAAQQIRQRAAQVVLGVQRYRLSGEDMQLRRATVPHERAVPYAPADGTGRGQQVRNDTARPGRGGTVAAPAAASATAAARNAAATARAPAAAAATPAPTSGGACAAPCCGSGSADGGGGCQFVPQRFHRAGALDARAG